MFINFMIWLLRKSKRSVMIGYEINGGHVKPLYNNAHTYDNLLINVDYRLKNGSQFEIPNGKFSYTVDEQQK